MNIIVFCLVLVQILRLGNGATISIGLLIEDHLTVEAMAVKFTVEFVNINILTPLNQMGVKIVQFNTSTDCSIIAMACKLIQSGVAAVIAPQNARNVLEIAPIFANLNIPLISASTGLAALSSNQFVTSMVPSNKILGQAIAGIMQSMRWSRVNLMVTQNHYGNDCLTALLKTASEYAWQVSSVNTFNTSITSIDRVISEIKSKHTRITILCCSNSEADVVLNRANNYGIIGRGWVWILSDVTMNSISSSSSSTPFDGLLGLGARLNRDPLFATLQSKWKEYYLADTTTDTAIPELPTKWVNAVLTVAHAIANNGTNFVLASRLNCFSNAQWSQGAEIMDLIKPNNLPISNIGLSQLNASFGFDIFNSNSGNWVQVAQYDNDAGFSLKTGKRIIFPRGNLVATDFESSLKGKCLRIVTINQPPFQIFPNAKDRANIKDDEIEGITIDLIRELSKALNFSYTLYASPDGYYGGLNKTTGKWNGMVRELVDGNADIAAAQITINAMRDSAIDFTTAFLDLGLQFQLLKDVPYQPSNLEFLNPFSSNLWLGVVGTMTAVAILLSLLEKISPMGYRGEFIHTCHNMPLIMDERDKRRMHYRYGSMTSSKMGITNTPWFTFSVMIHQGYHMYPQAFSSRIVTIVWWFAILVLITFYTAQSGSLEISHRLKSPINSVEDLYNQDVVSYGTIASSSVEQYFCNGHRDLHRNMCKKMMANNWMVNDAADGIARMKDRSVPYSLFGDSIFLQYLANLQPCDLRMVGDIFVKQGYGFGLEKGSPYKEHLSIGILQLREQGIIDGAIQKWILNKSECKYENAIISETDKFKKKFQDMRGIFVIIAVSICLSPVLVFIEFLYHCLDFIRKKREAGETWSFYSAVKLHLQRMSRDLTANCWPRWLNLDRFNETKQKYSLSEICSYITGGETNLETSPTPKEK